MSTYNTPMTKLEAVNICLSAMGETPVSTLDGVALDAQIAADLIDETSRSTQAMGFHWNHEVHTISPDVNGYLIVPSNTLRIDTVDGSKTVDVVQRGSRLYDRVNNTYTFTEDATVELYVCLPFEDLPFAAKNFIGFRAARLFEQRMLGSETLQKFNENDEKRAWVLLIQDEADTADANMLYDSWSTASILSRGTFARGAYI